MSYPIQSLVIIAPILFLVLIIGIPIIGVFAGWKRAAYWGGGIFFFYILGILIWSAAGNQIAQLILDALKGVLKDITVKQELMRSVAAPVFFFIIMFLAILILIINYYAWFKRVAKIKEDVKARKAMRAAKKAGKKAPKGVMPTSTWGKMQFTSKGRIINMTCGGVGLGLLMAPSTVTFTQAMFYLTTNTATRANNKFAAGLYDHLLGTAKAFDWMSYYEGTQTALDCDSMLCMLNAYTTKNPYSTMTTTVDSYGKATITINSKAANNGFQAFADIMNTGMNGVMTTSMIPSAVSTKHDDIVDAIDKFAEIWNPLIEKYGVLLTGTFASARTTELITSIIVKETGKGSKTPITKTYVEDAFGTSSQFRTVYKEYTSASWSKKRLNPIIVSEDAYYQLLEAVESIFDTTSLETEDPEYTVWWNWGLSIVMGLMFQIQE